MRVATKRFIIPPESDTHNMQLQDLGKQPRPKRPAHGREGKAIKIKANHFKVACRLVSAAHYDVTITGLRGRRGPETEEAPAEEEGGPPRRSRRPDAPTRPLPPEVCRCAEPCFAEVLAFWDLSDCLSAAFCRLPGQVGAICTRLS